MKQSYAYRILSVSFFVILFLTPGSGQGQCLSGTLVTGGAFTPQYTQEEETISTYVTQGHYFLVNIQPNKQYTFLSRFQNNQSYGYTGQITISNAEGTVPYAWGEGVVDWDSGPVSGQVRFYVHNNSCGSNSFPMRWSVMAYDTPCKPPTATSITNLTSTSVTLNWTPPAQMVPSNGFQYYISESDAQPFNFVQYFPSGYALGTSFNYNFLQPNKYYHWWVRSYCGSSVSYWVDGGNFTTPAVSCLMPSGLSVSDISSNSVHLSWSAPSPAPTGGYQYAINQSCLTPSSFSDVATTSLDYNQLSPNSTYCWWVRSSCGAGNFSNWAFGGNFTTSNAISCNNSVFPMNPGAPWNPSCTGLPETIVSNAKAGEYSKVIIQANRQYTFASSISTDYITITDEAGGTLIASGQTPLTWSSGSTAGTVRYFIHADAACATNSTPRTKTLICSGNPSSCTAPSNLSATAVTSTSAVLTWDAPVAAPFDGYQYYIANSPAAPNAGTVPSGDASSNFTGVAGLSSNTTYYFWVRSDCGSTVSNWVSGGNFTTSGATSCPEPISPNVTNITSNSAYFSWTQPSPAPSGGYDVYISTNSSTPIAAQTPNGNVDDGGSTFYNLPSATTFYFWVRSNCGSSNSAWVYGGSFATNAALNCNGAVHGLYPAATFTPSCTGNPENINTDAWPGEFCRVNVTANKNYIFSSSVSTDHITITNNAGNTILASGISPVSWSSGSFSGTLRYFLHADASCGNSQTARSRRITCAGPMACNVPSNIVISNITTVGASFSWTGASPAPSLGYQYYINTTGIAPTAAQFAWGYIPGTNFTANFLQPATTYYIWLRSDCDTTASAWVAGGSFTTLAGTSCPAPTGLTVFNITQGGATIACSPTNPEPSAGYEYYLNTSGVTPSQSTAAWGSLVGNSYTIDFVGPNSTYYYWIRSNCGSSVSAWIPGGSFTTLQDTPCPTPFNLTTSNVTTSTAQIDWSVSDAVYLFDLYLSTSSIAPTGGPNEGSTNLSEALLFNNIQPNTTYYWWVRSRCSDGSTSAWIYGGSFTTQSLENPDVRRSQFRVYPNPTENMLHISSVAEVDKVELFNLVGQRIIAKTAHENEVAVDLGGIPAGTYLLKIYNGTYSTVFKVTRK